MCFSEAVLFSVSMQEGTSVQVVWDYGDGTADGTHSKANLETWPSGSVVTKVHTYTTPGIYNCKVTIKNNYDDININSTLYVFNAVDHIKLTSDAPVAFNKLGSLVTFTLSPKTSLPADQYPPTLTNISFISLGDDVKYPITDLLQDIPYDRAFATFKVATHKYFDIGTYVVSLNISNEISSNILTTTVGVDVPISSFMMKVIPPHAPGEIIDTPR